MDFSKISELNEICEVFEICTAHEYFVTYTNICDVHEIGEVMIECDDCVLRTPALRASAVIF